MVRIREILDPDLKAKVIAKVAEWRGMTPGNVPEWFELDDADYTDILMEIRADEDGDAEEYDSRM